MNCLAKQGGFPFIARLLDRFGPFRMYENAFKNIDDLLHKDSGMSSELDYAEQTSWIMFLKYLDDMEAERADEAGLEGRDYAPILAPEYRWSAWAATH